MTPIDVDHYLIDGCGRCKFASTPQCKVHTWTDELNALRAILLNCGLTEEIKWEQPCYTFNQRVVVVMTAFKNFAAINFFKGALLSDSYHLLTKPGEATNAGRQLRYTDANKIIEQEDIIKSYVLEAIENEKRGLKIASNKTPAIIPVELQEKFNEIPELKIAFNKLTVSNQRNYATYISQAKQEITRLTRMEKCIPNILAGKRFQI